MVTFQNPESEENSLMNSSILNIAQVSKCQNPKLKPSFDKNLLKTLKIHNPSPFRLKFWPSWLKPKCLIPFINVLALDDDKDEEGEDEHFEDEEEVSDELFETSNFYEM